MKKVVMGRFGETTRLFEVDENLSASELTARYDAMLDALYAKGENIDGFKVSNEVLEQYGFHPYPAESFLVPGRHLGYERMQRSGISFASCVVCEHCESGVCTKYGGESEPDPMFNQDCCRNDGLVQVLDGDQVVEYFVLHDRQLLQNPGELLRMLSAWFPAVADMMEYGRTLCFRDVCGNQTEYQIP